MENEATVIEMVVFDCVSIARVFFILIWIQDGIF
jgi:hypothetical protein